MGERQHHHEGHGNDPWQTLPPCYEVQDYINRGAFGVVCSATVHDRFGRPDNAYFLRLYTQEDHGDADENDDPPQVAVKLIPRASIYASLQSVKQVYREATIMKQLIHPNVVKLVDLHLSPDGDLFFIMEKMPMDLERVINSDQLQEGMVRIIVYGVLRGLKYIHSAGIIHRDLKPGNILINENLEARICDFGWARPSAGDAQQTVTGYVTTRFYRAPEVMLTWEHYDAALDMWSVGCIFGEMLNRVRNYITAETRDRNTGLYYPHYALFPAEDHFHHLNLIISVTGMPSEEVMHACTDEEIRRYLMEQLEDDDQGSLYEYFSDVDESAVDLLQGLLDADPQRRLTATAALESEYVGGYHDVAEEYTRPVISRNFEQWDFPPEQWAPLYDRLVSDMGQLPPEAFPQADDLFEDEQLINDDGGDDDGGDDGGDDDMAFVGSSPHIALGELTLAEGPTPTMNDYPQDGQEDADDGDGDGAGFTVEGEEDSAEFKTPLPFFGDGFSQQDFELDEAALAPFTEGPHLQAMQPDGTLRRQYADLVVLERLHRDREALVQMQQSAPDAHIGSVMSALAEVQARISQFGDIDGTQFNFEVQQSNPSSQIIIPDDL